MKLIYNLLTCYLCFVFAYGEECTTEKVDECVALLPDTDNLPNTTDDEIRTVLTTFCEGYQNYHECLKPFTSNCKDGEQLHPLGYDRGYRHLCDQDIELLLNYYKCFDEYDLGPHCFDIFPDISAKPWIAGQCSAIESYVICIVDAMRDVCSETVSSFFNCFLRFIYVDLAELNDCEIKLDTCEESDDDLCMTASFTSLELNNDICHACIIVMERSSGS